MKLLLFMLLAFGAVQSGSPRKPKRRRKTGTNTAVSHQVFYQQDKQMTQELEALQLESTQSFKIDKSQG